MGRGRVLRHRERRSDLSPQAEEGRWGGFEVPFPRRPGARRYRLGAGSQGHSDPVPSRRGSGAVTRRRRAFIALLSVALVAVTLTSGYWWLFNTERGAKWGFERLGAFFPGRLDVTGMRGPLRGPLEIHHFAYKNDSLSITADRVFLRWHLQRLLRRRLDIDQLHADHVNVVWGAPGTTPQARDSLSGPIPDLNLPVSVVIREGILNRLTIKRPGVDSAAVIDRVELDAQSVRRDSLRVNHLTVKSKWLDVEF